MKPRYYVGEVKDGWAVWDRRILPGDEKPPVFETRREARARAKELNTQNRPPARAEVRHGL